MSKKAAAKAVPKKAVAKAVPKRAIVKPKPKKAIVKAVHKKPPAQLPTDSLHNSFFRMESQLPLINALKRNPFFD